MTRKEKGPGATNTPNSNAKLKQVCPEEQRLALSYFLSGHSSPLLTNLRF